MGFQMPMIKIQLDHMRQGIVAALADYTDELSKFVEEELERVIENFDFSGEVQRIAQDVIKRSIENYFAYGDGRKLIESAVNEALDEIFKL